MPEKPIALVVDDDEEWLSILEEALMPGFQVLKAKTIKDVIKLLENNDLRLEIALIDMMLNEDTEGDNTGLEVMFILNGQGIPCIGATAYTDGKSTRDALILGGAKDVWFKSQEKLIILRDKIKSVIESKKKVLDNGKGLVISPSFPSFTGEINHKLVFVLMPFSEEWSDDVLMLIRAVGEEHNLDVVRADDIFGPRNIVNDIWQSINKAGLIVADITRYNANVFYELGIAHTLGKDVMLIRNKNGEKSPFDISQLRYIEYELTPIKAEEFKRNISKVFKEHIAKHNII